jgi:hypothetical protein
MRGGPSEAEAQSGMCILGGVEQGRAGQAMHLRGGFWGKGNARQALERKKSRDSSIEVS